MYITTYEQIRPVKISAMKEIFNSMDEFKIYAETLTDNELVKSFDFFNNRSDIEDDEDLDVYLWWDYLELIKEKGFLSRETKRKLKAGGERGIEIS